MSDVKVGDSVRLAQSDATGRITAEEISEGVRVVAIDWGDGLEDWVVASKISGADMETGWVVPNDA